MSKFVYRFGNGQAEGDGATKDLLGGKGAGLAEMTASASRCRPASPSPPRSAPTTTRTGRSYPPELDGAAARRRRPRREARRRRQVRRRRRSAARQRALRRARLDARHDGHHPQPRPQRRHRRGAGREARARRASPTTPTAASSRCTATSCSASSPSARPKPTRSRRILEHEEGGARRPARHRARRARRCSELVAEFKAEIKQRKRARLPRRSVGAALGRDRRGLRQLEEPARRHLPQHARHPRRAGAPPSTCRRWSSATWATTAPPASRSRAIRRPASAASSASS